MHPVNQRRRDLYQAEIALVAVILLQISLNQQFLVGSRFLLASLEILLMLGIGITAPVGHYVGKHLRRAFSLSLIAIISLVNVSSLILVTGALVHGSIIPGEQLLIAALAIFATNLIVFSLWYWEIDSPGLTGIGKHHNFPKFLFPQMSASKSIEEFKDWGPSYFDYVYLSTTNATAFSPTDTLPLSHGAKALMGAQALVSLLTLALVAARAVNIIGG